MHTLQTRPEVYSCARFSPLPLSESVIPDMAKIWPFYGQNIVLKWPFIWVLPEYLTICRGMIHAKIPFAGWILKLPLQESLQCCPFITQKWSSLGPLHRLFLNLNQHSQECSMPNFTILGVSCSPIFLEMAKIWPFHGPNMLLIWSSNWFLRNHTWCA